MNANQGSIPLTKQGYEKLLQKVKRMKEVDRPAVIKAIEEARAHGDLSENAEYHAAKEKQGQIEAEIRTLESKLSRAQVIDTSRLSGERVVFGAHVKFLDVEKDEEFTYQIVGDEESDVNENRISILSPVGRALIGKEAGDLIAVNTPKGKRELEILEVWFS